MNLKTFCLGAVQELAKVSPEAWPALFIQKRLDLQRLYLKGLVLSTLHGAEIFENILFCLDNGEWAEGGEYGNNFRLFIEREK